MISEDLFKLFSRIVRQWDSSISLESVQPLTPDASLRRYYRLKLSPQSSKPLTLLAMVFDSIKCAEVAGSLAIGSDQSYVELTDFFFKHHVAVPELYYDARQDLVLFIEDLGDRLLADYLTKNLVDSLEQDKIRLQRMAYYRDAIDQIVKIQNIPKQVKFFPFQRSFSYDLYRKEIKEFQDYVLLPLVEHKVKRSNIFTKVGVILDSLAFELDQMPQVLVHRDFHSWNLMIDRLGELRVIDFQDALMGTRTYDVVGLLNDRDTDSALGVKDYKSLLKYFMDQISADDIDYANYDRVLLQRDLKVAGRFSKLSKERGLVVYEKWIPGTLRRIGRTLERIAEETGCFFKETKPAFKELLNILSDNITEISIGSKDPLRLR